MIFQKQRRWFLALSAATTFAAVGFLVGCGGSDGDDTPRYQLATWMSAQSAATGATAAQLTERTLRQVVHVSIGGEQLKIKFTNLFGTEPLVIDKIRVARSYGSGLSGVLTSSNTPVLFDGKEGVTIPAGEELFSDAIDLDVLPRSDLAVSMYVKQAVRSTVHQLVTSTNYMGDGDQTEAETIANPAQGNMPWAFMQEIDVLRSTPANVVVTFGDSITDGVGSTTNLNNRYPDQLSDRLNSGALETAVVNAGISGNRWLLDGAGPNGASRFARDVLNVSGVTHVIMLLGINDIGQGRQLQAQNDPNLAVTANKLTDAMQTATAAAKARGIKVLMATILPYKGASYYTDGTGATAPYNGEQIREDVNAWIRANSAGADAVLDWSTLMSDPADPLQMRVDWHTGDHLHPNPSGYARMANSIDLNLLRQ